MALDWGPEASPSLAELFRLSPGIQQGESFFVCLTPRTRRIFPQLSTWIEEEGFSEGVWRIDGPLEAELEEPVVLIGAPPVQLVVNGAEAQFHLLTLPARS